MDLQHRGRQCELLAPLHLFPASLTDSLQTEV
jgi:hypothetical protein